MKKKIIILITLCVIIVLLFVLYYHKTTKVSETSYNVSTQIAKQITVLRPSYMTAAEIDNYFKGTPLYGYGKYILIAERESGIGADIIAAIMAHESDFGRNYWTQSSCHNPFSWGVYGGKCHIPYNSVKGCIIGEWRNGTWHDGVPVLIKKLYLTKGAPYYAGETLYAIGTHYASDGSWYKGVERHLNEIPKTEDERAKEWAVGSKIFKPFNREKGIKEPADYWTKSMSKLDFAKILYRLNKGG